MQKLFYITTYQDCIKLRTMMIPLLWPETKRCTFLMM